MSDTDYQSIPTDLPPRWEIRRLEEKHLSWASAIVAHSNIFHSPIWPLVYPEDKCGRLYRAFAGMDYLARLQINSGLSFGVFDTEYKFKRPESEAEGGKLYWDPANPSKDESGAELLEQMDFPLVSVALSYDAHDELDEAKLGPLIESIPAYPQIFVGLQAKDTRDPKSWKATGPRQLLMRNATASRRDMEGKQIMKKLAYFLMRYAHKLGFRGIHIEPLHDKVIWVWSHPPAPFKGNLVAEFNCDEYTIEENGKTVKPFEGSVQRATMIYLDLNAGSA